jgi:cell division protein FtsQ
MNWFKIKQRNRIHRHDLRGMDAKLRARVRNQRQTRMAAWIAIGIFGASVFIWGLFLALQTGYQSLFSRNDAYSIANVVIETTGQVIRKDQVISHLRLRRGMNLLALDLAQVRKDLEQMPMIHRAEVSRELPDTLVLRILERVPIANVSSTHGSRRYQIDRYGVVMDLLSYARKADEVRTRLETLPRIVGVSAADLKIGRVLNTREMALAIELIQKLDQNDLGVSLELASINVSHRNTLVLNTTDGSTIRVNGEGMDRQLLRLAHILESARQNSERVATVDLTVGGRDVPVTLVSAP